MSRPTHLETQAARAGSLPGRRAMRGTLLIVVLALLVVLSLIGIAFGFIVIAEQQSASNALVRFKAQSAARDGEAFAVAALRNIPLISHFDQRGYWTFGGTTDIEGKFEMDDETYLERMVAQPFLQPTTDPGRQVEEGSEYLAVSFSKANSTSTAEGENLNWVDLNGNGVIDESNGELRLGEDYLTDNNRKNVLREVSYFVGEGIDRKMFKNQVSAGTFRELGDRARLKIIDTNSQLNLNDYNGPQLSYMLQVLGKEIAAITQRPPVFTENIANGIVRLKSRIGNFQSKSQLLPLFEAAQITGLESTDIEFAMDFIAVHSYPQPGAGGGTQPNFNVERNPILNARVDAVDSFSGRDPFRETALGGDDQATGTNAERDGRPETIPNGSRLSRSPININTVTKPVLVAMLAGIEAEARFLYYPKREVVTATDPWNSSIESLQWGVTDAGRQPVSTNTDEDKYSLPKTNGLNNRSSYQVIPIGPLGYEIEPVWKRGADQLTDPWYGSAKDNAVKLAEAILRERDNEPFRSWMDFDYRICHQLLSGFGNSAPSRNSADLVATDRANRQRELDSTLQRAPWGSAGLLPDPRELQHPAAGTVSSANTSYTTAEFNAWYWRACVDMVRSALNPNGYLNKFNPDSAYYTTVDSTDLKYNTAPLCFSSMGVYEVVSQGEIIATQIGDLNANTSGSLVQDVPIARRTFRSVVEVYTVKEHTTQRDFLQTLVAEDFRTTLNGTSANTGGKRQLETVMRHDFEGTLTYPHSIDHQVFEYADEMKAGNVGSGALSIYKGIPKRSQAAQNAQTGNGEKALGFFRVSQADETFGWITLRPLDRTPLEDTQGGSGGAESRLNAHFPYNWGLDGRQRGASGGLEFGNTNNAFGAAPYVGDASGNAIDNNMLDSLGSASPSARTDLGNYKGFEEASDEGNTESARYSTLRPDGVLLRAWHLNPMFRLARGEGTGPGQTYRLRNQNRMSRLALLRYRAGFIGNTPFAPINDQNPDSQKEDRPGAAIEAVKQRIAGGANGSGDGGDQATDLQNIALQDSRQKNSNFPYYEGWVDFWVKWELPPQGGQKKAVCAGEIDPGSGNFSGLLGATAYGRFAPSAAQEATPGVVNPSSWQSASEAADADFEGHEFFVFKEPGGIIRITSIYFTDAWTAVWGGGGSTGGPTFQAPTGYHHLGNKYRISGKLTVQPGAGDPPIDPNDPLNQVAGLDNLIATNDVCGKNPLDLGFSYARMESWVDLNDPNVNADLVTHNWYRMSLKYRSNARFRAGAMATRAPHELFIDGRPIALNFEHPRISPTDQSAQAGATVNTGELVDEQGNLVLVTSWDNQSDQNVDFWVLRRSLQLAEVDPEDRLTIGCVYRRQQPNEVRDASLDFDNTAPLFRYDSNVIAPANATLDDVRIFWQLNSQFGGGLGFTEDRAKNFSRFQSIPAPEQARSAKLELRGMYENGFIADAPAGGTRRLYPFPVRIASIAWTEYRPWWDSFKRERIDYNEQQWARGPHVYLTCQIVNDIARPADSADPVIAPSNAAFDSTSRDSAGFWLNGGYAFSDIGDRPVYIRNDTSKATDPTVGLLMYRAYFINPADSPMQVLNNTPVLDDVRITMLTPPRRVYSEEVLR